MSDEKVLVLVKGEKCPDYPKIKQMSVQCQNCRFNRFSDGNISDQKCLPHSAAEAKRKGAPTAAPAEFYDKWMNEVERRAAEKKLRGEGVEA